MVCLPFPNGQFIIVLITSYLDKLQKKITNLNLAASYGDDVPQTNHDFQ